jgi:hypothetical protein
MHTVQQLRSVVNSLRVVMTIMGGFGNESVAERWNAVVISDETNRVAGHAPCWRRHRISASMKASMSPSSTPEVLPTSTSVRASLTSW